MDTPWLDQCVEDHEAIRRIEAAQPSDPDFNQDAFILMSVGAGIRKMCETLEHMAEELLDPKSEDGFDLRMIRMFRHFTQLENFCGRSAELTSTYIHPEALIAIIVSR